MVATVNTKLNSKLPIDSFNEWSETVATKEEVSGKVDKVDGKGLSTNDYTDADKEKLTALPTEEMITDSFTILNRELDTKVDKEEGKGLSTNDYTDSDKAKLAATPSFWVGTQAEYDAITTKDTKTFYYIVEE